MILEELMLDLMYHLPSQKKLKEFEVTREMVEKRDVSMGMMEKAARTCLVHNAGGPRWRARPEAAPFLRRNDLGWYVTQPKEKFESKKLPMMPIRDV